MQRPQRPFSHAAVGWALLLAALGSSPATAGEKTRVLVISLAPSEPGLRQLADSLSEQVLTELGHSRHIAALGQSDLAAVLGLERQKQLLGCSDSSCVAEVSAALGAPFVIAGSLARLGQAIRIDLKVIRASDGSAVWRGGRTTRDETQLFDEVADLLHDVIALPQLEPPTTAEGSSRSAFRVPQVVLTGVGAAAALAGITFSVVAAVQWGRLSSAAWRGDTSWSGVDQTGRDYNRNVVLGPALAAAGVAAVVAAVVWALVGAPP